MLRRDFGVLSCLHEYKITLQISLESPYSYPIHFSGRSDAVRASLTSLSEEDLIKWACEDDFQSPQGSERE